MDRLKRDYPWTQSPLVAGAPMRLIAMAKLAAEISIAGGLGFIGAGSDASCLEKELAEAKQLLSEAGLMSTGSDDTTGVLPIGVGFLLWAGDTLLQDSLPWIEKYTPAAIWLFAPRSPDQLVRWTRETRRVSKGRSKVWIQIGTVAEALSAVQTCKPDVLVVQGTDAGGHGLEQGAGIVPLLPEVDDAVSKLCEVKGIEKPVLVAAGGIMDGRGIAASLPLGAKGVVMGTRYLAAPEAVLAQGYRDAVLGATDGGVNTARGKLYDTLRGTTDWPVQYGGRGVLNESWFDAVRGMSVQDNKLLYEEAVRKGDEGWGSKARLTTYAGSGVGLVRGMKGAGDITVEVREDAKRIWRGVRSSL